MIDDTDASKPDGISGSVIGSPTLWQLWIAMALAVGVIVAGSAFRSVARYDIPEIAEFDRSLQGQFDFHNGVYYPALAFMQGVSPYGEEFAKSYPVTRPLPLVSPLMPLLHLPLACLHVRVAEFVYFAFNTLMHFLIAWLSVNWIKGRDRRITLWLATCLIVCASRAGHTTLFTGYMTAELVCGSLIAITMARSNPWLAAFGVAVTSCKPTYAIPLFLLMNARGDYLAAWRGLALSIAGALIAIGRLLLVWTPQQLWIGIQHGQSSHMTDSYELPINTWTRVDTLSVVAKWMAWNPSEMVHLVVMVLLLPLPAFAIWQLNRGNANRQAAGLSSGILAVSIVATIYHHVYDSLLLFPVIVGLLLGEPSLQRGSARIRLIIAALLLFVTWNYPSSEIAVKVTGISGVPLRLLTSTGPIALAAGWFGLCALPFLNSNKSSGCPPPLTSYLKSIIKRT